jgi:hypothetical protein
MSVKTIYDLGDTVWIYGVSRDQNKPTKGRIVRIIGLEDWGYPVEQDFYVIEIQTSIEPIFEVRTWETISQDEKGPVGAFRQAVTAENIDAVDKQLSQIGLNVDGYENIVPEPMPTEKHHKPSKGKNRYYRKKKHKS